MNTVKNMIAAIRSLVDEQNESNLDDALDILPALQRGYDHAINVISRHYVDSLLATKIVNIGAVDADGMYDIPADAFEDRLLKVEVNYNGGYVEILRLNYTDLTPYETPTRTAIPYYYTVVGRKFKLTPNATAPYPMRLWYAKHPGALQMEQGRVTAVNIAGNYVVCADLDPDLSTNQSSLAGFVNIVDGQTGEIKATMQLQSVAGGRVTFKSVPSRISIYGREVTGTLPAAIKADDLICHAEGSAIPIIQHSVCNFLIQYAVLDVTRKLGADPTVDKAMKDELSNNLEKLAFGREPDTRIKKRNKSWTLVNRRWWSGGPGS